MEQIHFLLTEAGPRTKTELLVRLRRIIRLGWTRLPDGKYGGTGGPGRYLEDLLGLDAGNRDIADCIGFEVKWHTRRTALISLFHKEAEPQGIMRAMVDAYGWLDVQGRLSFRHTIKGRSDRFQVVDVDDKVEVRPLSGVGPICYWTHNTLLNVAGGKLRRLVSMEGERDGQMVRFTQATLYENMHLTRLIQDLVNGQIAIDFDVRDNTAGSRALRNHGTKFRVPPLILPDLYITAEKL